MSEALALMLVRMLLRTCRIRTRGRVRPPAITGVVWYAFDKDTFTVGRANLPNDVDLDLSVYYPERCVIDTFRLAYREGTDVATTALKRWLAKRGNSSSALLEMAKAFPRALLLLHRSLESFLSPTPTCGSADGWSWYELDQRSKARRLREQPSDHLIC